MKLQPKLLPKYQPKLQPKPQPKSLPTFPPIRTLSICCATAGLCTLLAFSGCDRHATQAEKAEAAQAAAQKQQLADEAVAARRGIHAADARLDQLPPPYRTRYAQVRTIQSWSNPFLLVGRKTVTLRFANPQGLTSLPNRILPSQTLSNAGPQKSEITLQLIDLPEALAALPDESWPYGRVVAVDEDPSTPRRDRPQMRRNVEAVMALLNDLDVVADEWPTR
jgi:hypothetical protein